VLVAIYSGSSVLAHRVATPGNANWQTLRRGGSLRPLKYQFVEFKSKKDNPNRVDHDRKS
jgi:hypothetical protein